MSNQRYKILSRIAAVSLFVLLFAACNGRPSGVLNESEMTDVLTEFHTLDGSLIEKGMQYNNDSVKAYYYRSILNKYDVTPAEFDSSLVWYTKNPKQFELVYEAVTTRLANLDSEIKKGKYYPVDSVELSKTKMQIWNKRASYKLTKDSTRTRIEFEVKDKNFLMGDVYLLRFLQRIAPEDSCKRQHVVLRINYANGKSDSAFVLAHNDSLLRRYSLRLPALKKLKIKSISGALLGSKAYKGKMNASLDSISLMRIYQSAKQDSLLKVVNKADPKNYEIADTIKRSKGSLIKLGKVKVAPTM